MPNAIHETQRLGQSIWYDNMRRSMISSGELQRLVDIGITGITSNPTIFEKAITGSTDYDETLSALVSEGMGVVESYEALTVEDIQNAADILRPVYEATNGTDGYASLEVSPLLAQDTDGTVEEATRLYWTLNRPNVLVKVPATLEGIPAIRTLIGQGININVTLIFSLNAYADVMEAYIAGLEDLARDGADVTKSASVASFFVSRLDTVVDELIEKHEDKRLAALYGMAAVSNAQLAYQAFKAKFGDERFGLLHSMGAKVQRPLWASTGTKNPEYSDVLYVESLIGPDTVNTMPEATLTAFLEHGSVEATLEHGVEDATNAIKTLEFAGISMDKITSELLVNGVNAFTDSFNSLLGNIAEKSSIMSDAEKHRVALGLGVQANAVDETFVELLDRNIASRIWSLDHTVWSDDATDIDNRLGWLTIAEDMTLSLGHIQSFVEEIKDADYTKVMLLGMGGSSLGPRVLRDIFGTKTGYPELTILDSTYPNVIRKAAESSDPSRTLYLVSSKSGTTKETLMMYRYFRDLVEKSVGRANSGDHFVAITERRSPLARMAHSEGFRRIFETDMDFGGRYSVLSHFGLVPAAITGVDIELLLRRAIRMQRRCSENENNSAVWLSAAIGTLARAGQDKLTILTSGAIAAFGPWVEQLIAESTGKDCAGILPVINESILEAVDYGRDRLFVYLRLVGDDNDATDVAINELQKLGHPTVRIDLKDRYDIGAEFFRWQFSTAVVGSMLTIQPFDQPNVQQSKEETAHILKTYEATGCLPDAKSAEDVATLLAATKANDYVAILAYVDETQEVGVALTDLRTRITKRYGIATTVGYGPRYLHSTGQFHKGGPHTGVFIMITTPLVGDVTNHGESCSFDTLTQAQVTGDLQVHQRLGHRVCQIELGQDAIEAIYGIEID